jgi:TM2 domain-containing membrane protein YozV
MGAPIKSLGLKSCFLILFFTARIAAAPNYFSDEPFQNRSDYKSNTPTGKGTERRIIFTNFYNESKNDDYNSLSTSIGETVYQSTKSKYVYERIDDQIWKTHASARRFKDSDFNDRDKIQEMGLALGADGIVFGKFVVTEKEIKIHGKILAVLTREIIAEAETTIPHKANVQKEIEAFSETLSKRVRELFLPSDLGAVWRSALLPGWGQYYKGRITAGKIYGGAVGTAFVFTMFSLVMWHSSYRTYRNYVPEHFITPQGGTELVDPRAAQEQFDKYQTQAQSWQTITLVSAGVTVAIYLWQIIDAWIFETEHSKLGRRVAADSGSVFWSIGRQLTNGANPTPNSLAGQDNYTLKIRLAF